PSPPERPGEFGVSAGRGGAGEFREAHGQGERADLRGYETGGGEPHHHPGLMGVFIVVEGPEGAGKSTLVRWLAARLVTEGLQVTAVRQPGGTPVAVGRARQRAARKVQDRFERQDDALHRRVLEAYRRAAGPGVVHVDATQSKKAVQEAAWREVMAVTALSTRGVS